MDIDQLIGEQAIARQLSCFARILDGKRWDDLGDVFAADLTFNYGEGGEQSGIDALRSTVSRFLDVCGPTQHLIGSMIITVDDERASTRAYVQARHQRAGDPAGAVFDSCGDYIDQWERRAGNWLIVRRDVHWLLHHGNPEILATTAENIG